jgi:hypothetical protein
MRQRAETIVFELEQPVGIIEGGNPLPERHRQNGTMPTA